MIKEAQGVGEHAGAPNWRRDFADENHSAWDLKEKLDSARGQRKRECSRKSEDWKQCFPFEETEAFQ